MPWNRLESREIGMTRESLDDLGFELLDPALSFRSFSFKNSVLLLSLRKLRDERASRAFPRLELCALRFQSCFHPPESLLSGGEFLGNM